MIEILIIVALVALAMFVLPMLILMIIGTPIMTYELLQEMISDFSKKYRGKKMSKHTSHVVKQEIAPEERDLIPDGIDCRDETIKLQDKRIEALEAENKRLRHIASHIDPRVYIAAKEKAGYGTEIKAALAQTAEPAKVCGTCRGNGVDITTLAQSAKA